jgi:hypothetical protein
MQANKRYDRVKNNKKKLKINTENNRFFIKSASFQLEDEDDKKRERVMQDFSRSRKLSIFFSLGNS